jgi:uncharacterized protein YunC (DUF1805 family)
MKLTLISLALAALTTAQDLSSLPSCSLTCLTTGVQSVGCGLTDVECACKKSDELTTAVTPCVVKACDQADQAKLVEALATLCGGKVVTPAPSVSSVVEVAPTSQAAPAPTTSVQTTATTVPSIAQSTSKHILRPCISPISADR